MSAPAACLFDLDGLLLDTEPLHGLAWRRAADHFGLQLTDAELMQLRGRRRQENARQVCDWIAAGTGSAPSMADLLPAAAAMDGAPELLRRCHKRQVAMALVTSSSRESLALKTAGHPWLDLIELRIHGDDPDLRDGKPAPDPFLLAAERLGVNPGDCWAFEDSPAGALSAAAAGCRVHVLLPEGGDTAAYPAGVCWLTSLREILL